MNKSPCWEEVEKPFQGCCLNPLLLRAVVESPKQNAVYHEKSNMMFAGCRKNFADTTTSSFFPSTAFTNHESLPSLQESLSQFLRAYPQYHKTSQIDKIRAREYHSLSHIPLDYIGIGLFSQSQLASSSSQPPQPSDFPFFDVCFKAVNLKSQLLHGGEGSELESAIKKRIMDHLNISENEYCMAFTANRSSAFKLVAESYPFGSQPKLLTVYDHESEAIAAMADAAEKRGACTASAEFKWPRLRVHSAKLREMIVKKKNRKGLFVFPLESGVTGSRYSSQWIKLAQENNWDVLLDGSAMGPKDMDSLGLSLYHPEFIVCSFYKVLGINPTGFSCLFVKKSILSILENSTTTGIVTLLPQHHQILTISHNNNNNNASNSSTSSTQQQIGNKESTEIACRYLDKVDSLRMMIVNNRKRYLMNWLVSVLMKLQHPNKLETLVRIYGPKIKFDRGNALALNLYDWKGKKIEPSLIQKLADRNNICINLGFIKHVWFEDKHDQEKDMVLEQRKSRADEQRRRSKKTDLGIEVVTISFNLLTNFEDVYRFWVFIAQFLDADFVEKEKWRYTALNQKTIEV